MKGDHAIYYLFLLVGFLLVACHMKPLTKTDNIQFGKIRYNGEWLAVDVLEQHDTITLTFSRNDLDSMSELTYDLVVKRLP